MAASPESGIWILLAVVGVGSGGGDWSLRSLERKIARLSAKVDRLVEKIAPYPKPGQLIFDTPTRET